MSSASSAAAKSLTQAVNNPQPIPEGSTLPSSISVSDSVIGQIEPGFSGLSYEKSSLWEPLFTGNNANLIGLFQRLGTGVLRIGGNSVDQSVWNANGSGQKSGQIAPKDVDALAEFLDQTGWQCIYAVNLGGFATGATSPELAAAEVAYVSQKLGSALVGVEIGNECDCYGATNSYFPGSWSLSQFEQLWQQFRTAIVNQTPEVQITGPASSGNESSWTVPFAKDKANEISTITQHYYRGDGHASTATASALVASDPALNNFLSVLKAGSTATGVPFRMAECNSYWNGGAPGVSDTLASSLWVLDFLFNCAVGGASGVNLHGGANNSYTPIADASGTVTAVRPEYYGLLMFALAGEGSVCKTTVTANGQNVTAYAILNATGGRSLMIVNKETSNQQLTIDLPGTVSTAFATIMSGTNDGTPTLTEGSVTIQGSAVGNDGSFFPQPSFELTPGSSSLSCYVPALSAILIQTT